MKKLILCLIASSFSISGFCQDLKFEVHGAYRNSIKKEKLDEAKVMSDIIPGYPLKWVSGYVYTLITTTCDGKKMLAKSVDDVLSAEQQNILKRVDQCSDIVIDIRYRYFNFITNKTEIGTLDYSTNLIPESEAEFAGGYEQMREYLKENAISRISDTTKKFQRARVNFTVNEQGDISDAQISASTGHSKIDNLLLEAINKMPKWKPAENSKGIKIKQNFVFTIGDFSGGC